MSAPDGSKLIYGTDATGQPGAIGISTPTQATGTLTLAANANAGETVTITPTDGSGPWVYTWIVALTATGFQVKIGVDASTSIDNLIAAINKATGDGSLYSYNTPQCTAVSAAAGAGDTMVVTAKAALFPAGAGNLIGTTESMASGSWGGTVLSGGAYGGMTTGLPTGGATAANQATQIAQGVAATNVPTSLTAGQSVTIPAGSKEWTATVLTGTASFGAATGLPAGFSDGSTKTNAATFTITFDTPGTGYVRYAT